jgi:hypothetical protein
MRALYMDDVSRSMYHTVTLTQSVALTVQRQYLAWEENDASSHAVLPEFPVSNEPGRFRHNQSAATRQQTIRFPHQRIAVMQNLSESLRTLPEAVRVYLAVCVEMQA